MTTAAPLSTLVRERRDLPPPALRRALREAAHVSLDEIAQENIIARYAGKPSAASKKAAAEAKALEKQAKALRAKAAAEAKKGSGFAAEYSRGAAELEKKAAAARRRAQKGAGVPLPKPKRAPLVGQGPLRPGETRKPASYTGAAPPRGRAAAPVGPPAPAGPRGATTGGALSPLASGGTTAGGGSSAAPGFDAPGAPADPAAIDQMARDLYSHMEWALNDGELGPLLRQATAEGWDENRLKGAVFKTNWFRTHGTAKIQSEVRKQADEYLVTLTDDDAKRWSMQIITGEVQPVEFTSWAKEMAKSRYGGLSGAIDRGVTVRQYASQYLADAANVLEVPVESLNLKEAKWMRAIEGEVDPKTKERVPMSRADWERTLKTDSIYGYDFTKGARTEASLFASKLAETFGAVG